MSGTPTRNFGLVDFRFSIGADSGSINRFDRRRVHKTFGGTGGDGHTFSELSINTMRAVVGAKVRAAAFVLGAAAIGAAAPLSGCAGGVDRSIAVYVSDQQGRQGGITYAWRPSTGKAFAKPIQAQYPNVVAELEKVGALGDHALPSGGKAVRP